MTDLAALLGAAARIDGGLAFDIPDDWRQGRTAYGGLSAAAALSAVRAIAPDLPPLRSAQIAFVGPLAGRIEARARLLRQGRSVTFATAELTGDGGVGLVATLVFAADRVSALDHGRAGSVVPEPRAAVAMAGLPAFTAHFDYAEADPLVRGVPHIGRWVRLRGGDGLDAATTLLAIGDALPPAAVTLLRERQPLSSVDWTVEFTDPHPTTRDGWWLLRSTAQATGGGYSTQTMTIHDRDGHLVAIGTQTVAIFG